MARKLDQGWYEQAAAIIVSSYTGTKERLAVLNEIWGEYLLATKDYVGPTYTQKIVISEEALRNIFEQAILSTTGIELKQIIDHLKEMTKNGQNETKATATGAEQLG